MIKIFISPILLSLLYFSADCQNLKFQPFFTAITVKNIDSSINWYTKVLDLKIRNRVDNDTRGFKQAILINNNIMIELVELKKSISADSLLLTQSPGTQVLGIYKFGFTVPKIDSLFQHLTAMAITFHGKMVVDPVNNKKTFLVSDPDGNLIQFFEN